MKTLSWLISMGVHGCVLLIAGLSVQQAAVGISPGRNSVEVNLVATPSDSESTSNASTQSPADEPVLPPITSPSPQMAEVPLPVISKSATLSAVLPTFSSLVQKQHPSTEQSAQNHRARPNHATGKETITAQSITGAIVDEKPDYLSNPPPLYPQAARDQEQEGLVVLDVIVSPKGESETIKVSSTSGYDLLDNAAEEAVRHYRFRPATLEGLKVRAHVRVPIRFRLDR